MRWTMAVVFGLSLFLAVGCARQAITPEKTIPDNEAKRRWNIARSVIEHEDDLITSRVNTFLTLQGLLFGALGLVIKTYTDNYPIKRSDGAAITPTAPVVSPAAGQNLGIRFVMLAFSMLICSIGAISSLLTTFDVVAARQEISHIDNWWNTYRSLPGGHHWDFPNLVGSSALPSLTTLTIGTDCFAPVMMIIWLLGLFVIYRYRNDILQKGLLVK